ncbi:MAG: hypothetical protein JO228_11075 [Xanthobacteraceae bacterium]|nr:hypothetical protein [Xanthobacteraceae bacterium]
MARGWLISAFSPNSGEESPPSARFLVAIHDQDAARRAIAAWHPGFRVVIEGEASAELLAMHRVKDGTIFMLDEES